MNTKRVPRYCDTCKRTTPHEIAGRFRTCTVCRTTIERLATAGDREADGTKRTDLGEVSHE